MIVYDSAGKYVQSAATIKERITRLDAIISALEDIALTATADENLTEYNLDDGQTKIRAAYRGTGEILKSIHGFIQLREMYVNKLDGRVMRLVDSKNLHPSRYR